MNVKHRKGAGHLYLTSECTLFYFLSPICTLLLYIFVNIKPHNIKKNTSPGVLDP